MDQRRIAHLVLAASLLVPLLLILLWFIGLFAFHVGAFIHLLLVLALMLAPVGLVAGLILLIISGRK